VVVHLDVAESVVALLLARRQERCAEFHRRRLDRETKPVTVEIVALGDLEADFQGLSVEGVRRRLEGECRVEKFIGAHQGA
jgi:hypothetical protein